METLQINSGEKQIAINGDPERVIVFNPTDIMFAERFYEVYRELEAKQAEFLQRAEELDKEAEADDNGLPNNMLDGLEFTKSVCVYVRSKIDELFGVGTSQKAFGEAMSMDMIAQFFEGMVPFIEQARTDRVNRYAKQSKPRLK